MSMKVLKPSSIHAWRRSLEPTIIGNQLWPISCALIQNNACPRRPCRRRRSRIFHAGAVAAELIAAGHGYGYQLARNARPRPSDIRWSGPSLSVRHALRPDRPTSPANVLPPGRLMRAASQTKAGDAAKATSRVLSMWKRQVCVPSCVGRLAGSPTSSGVRIITVRSLCRGLRQALPLRLASAHRLPLTSARKRRPDHIPGHGDRIIEIAVVEIELLARYGACPSRAGRRTPPCADTTARSRRCRHCCSAPAVRPPQRRGWCSA